MNEPSRRRHPSAAARIGSSSRRGLLEQNDQMESGDHGGGFSLAATVRIEANDRRGLERRLRYCARPPFAADRLEQLDAHRLIYHLPQPGPGGRTQLILSPLPLIGRFAALVPPPRRHRHRYYGALAPHSSRRPAVTARAPAAVAFKPNPTVAAAADDPVETIQRPPAHYLWAIRPARLYQAFPLTCPHCGAERRIIAFITEAVNVRAILEHLGEPSSRPDSAGSDSGSTLHRAAGEDGILPRRRLDFLSLSCNYSGT